MYKTKNSKTNMCDFCDHNIPDCDSSEVTFGDGLGDDNIIACPNFVGESDGVFREIQFDKSIMRK